MIAYFGSLNTYRLYTRHFYQVDYGYLHRGNDLLCVEIFYKLKLKSYYRQSTYAITQC